MNRPPTRDDLRGIARRAMIAHGLQPDYPAATMAELSRLDARSAGDGSAIKDLTGLLWMSVDNDSSRDLDQLSYAEPLDGHRTRVLIAVADVDALVPEGSAIDQHAGVNTTTVYTAGGIFPMIPERLSTDLTSLNQDARRVA